MTRLFLIAVLLRVAVFLTASGVYHIPLTNYVYKDDGVSYIKYAKAICGDTAKFTEYDRRVFPGYPTLIALAHVITRLPFAYCALLIDFVCAGIAAVAAWAFFAERRIGLAMLYLIPHYLLISSLAMSEAPVLAFTLVGLLLIHRRHHSATGGVIMGLAMLIRPMACFALAGSIIAFITADPRWRRKAATLLTAAAIPVIAALAVMYCVTGDPLRNVHVYQNEPWAYRGGILRLPFYSLVMTPWHEHVHLAVVAYIYAHVVLVIVCCVILARRCQKRRDTLWLDRLAFTWLIGNTLFQLCIGSQWGFRHFPRFSMPAQPAMFWALCPWLPRKAPVWWIGAMVVFAMAVVGVNYSP